MLLNWVVLFRELESRNRRTRRDPFADPLERPEWRGLLWAVPVIARLAAGRSAGAEVARRKDGEAGESLKHVAQKCAAVLRQRHA